MILNIFEDGTTTRNRSLYALGLRNDKSVFIALGFAEADKGKSTAETYSYYQQIIEKSGHKQKIYEKTVCLGWFSKW